MLSTTHPHGRALPGYVGLLRFSPVLTGLLSAVLVAGFNLAEPTPASARTIGGERALLANTQAVAPIAALRGAPYQSAARDSRFSAGERALLGTSSQTSRQLGSKAGDVQSVFATRGSVGGEEALLGTRKRPKAVKQHRLGEDS